MWWPGPEQGGLDLLNKPGMTPIAGIQRLLETKQARRLVQKKGKVTNLFYRLIKK